MVYDTHIDFRDVIVLSNMSVKIFPSLGIDAAAAKSPSHYLAFLPSMENMRCLALSHSHSQGASFFPRPPRALCPYCLYQKPQRLSMKLHRRLRVSTR